MEKFTRTMAACMLALYALLLGGGLLLGGIRPAHLSFCVAFALAVLAVALLALWQKRRHGPTLWERLGAGRTAALLLGFCFALNLAWVLLFRLAPSVDYLTFWRAANCLAGKDSSYSWEYVAMFPHILGYSAFLSLFLRVFGNGALVAPILNVCITTLSGWFLFRLCLRWRGLNTAAAALLLWALLPSKLLYNTMVLSEPYYTCLLLAALFLAAELEARRPGLARAALYGALAGLLLRLVQTARPIGPVPILALLIWLVCLRPERGREQTRCYLAFTALLLTVYLALGPVWNAWAERTLGEKPASVPGYSFYVGFDPESLGSYSEEDMSLLFHYRYETENNSADLAQRCMFEEAKARLAGGGIPYGRLLREKLLNFLGYDEGGAYYSRAGLSERGFQILAVGSNICYYAIGLLSLYGAWTFVKSGERGMLLLAPLYVVGLTLAQLTVEVSSRYHYSVLPMLIMLAACGCAKPAAD